MKPDKLPSSTTWDTNWTAQWGPKHILSHHAWAYNPTLCSMIPTSRGPGWRWQWQDFFTLETPPASHCYNSPMIIWSTNTSLTKLPYTYGDLKPKTHKQLWMYGSTKGNCQRFFFFFFIFVPLPYNSLPISPLPSKNGKSSMLLPLPTS